MFRFDRVLGRGGLALEDLRLRLVLEDGRLNVDPVTFQWNGGRLEAKGGVDASGSEAKWRMRTRARGVPLESLAAQFSSDDPTEGVALVVADLESRGETVQELMQSLEGGFSVALRDGVLRGASVLLLRRDLLLGLALRPIREDVAEIHCLVGRFHIEGGVATTETLLLDGEKVLLHGRGSIDLGRERLDIVLTPKAKRPGIGLIHPLVVKGSFQQPQVRPLKRGLAKHAAKALVGSLLVPGAGTIAPFLQTGTLDKDPCGKSLATYLEPE